MPHSESIWRGAAGLEAALPADLVGKRLRRAQLSHGCSTFVENQSVDIVDEVGEGDLGLGTGDADGADEQRQLILLPGEHVLDTSTDGLIWGR